ncbi:hypothetical protein [Streptomyces sp. NPDC060322]|uniref:hypothetical protein n=1 Tax=Streptomyces sp. NPDC060322 TaxID=3347097 RepID=UPI003652EC2E
MKLQERARSRNAVHVLVGAGLLPEGTKLLMTPRHGTSEAIRDAINAWVEEDSSRATAIWTNNTAQPLIWDADGASYFPTGLANHIFTSVTSRTADGIQGTTWWDVDTSQVPSDADVEEWATLAGINLSGPAKQLNGTRKDWTCCTPCWAQSLLDGGPPRRRGSSDRPPCPSCRKTPECCGQCPSPWRVLNAAGRVSNGFQWTDRTRTDTPTEILGTEGVRFNGAVADADKRLAPDALRRLLDT